MRRQLDHHVDMQKTDANVRDQSAHPALAPASPRQPALPPPCEPCPAGLEYPEYSVE
jgi:hypothetical protein